MSERFEFASEEWVDALRSIIEKKLSGVDLAGITYSFCEEFTDAPHHLRLEQGGAVGWYYRIDAGRVEVNRGVLEDSDTKIVADYAMVLPLARMVFADDPTALPEATKLMREATAAGKMRQEGDAAANSALPQLATIHDDIARLTA